MLRSSSDVRYVLPVYLLLGGIVGLAPQSASECDDGKCCWEGERPPPSRSESYLGDRYARYHDRCWRRLQRA